MNIKKVYLRSLIFVAPFMIFVNVLSRWFLILQGHGNWISYIRPLEFISITSQVIFMTALITGLIMLHTSLSKWFSDKILKSILMSCVVLTIVIFAIILRIAYGPLGFQPAAEFLLYTGLESVAFPVQILFTVPALLLGADIGSPALAFIYRTISLPTTVLFWIIIAFVFSYIGYSRNEKKSITN